MYQLLAMDSSLQLYQLGLTGWKRWVEGPGVCFGSVEEVREYLFTHFIGELPDTVDAYIAQVDHSGTILRTFSLLEECNESNDSNQR